MREKFSSIMCYLDSARRTTTRAVFTLWFLLLTTFANSQVLRDINYSYLYNPVDNYLFTWKVLNINDEITLYYALESSTFLTQPDAYRLEWEVRPGLSDKTGNPVAETETARLTGQVKSGVVKLEPSMAGQYAVAKVFGSINEKQKSLTLFYKAIPKATTPSLFQRANPVLRTYIQQNSEVTVRGFRPGQSLIASYYSVDFPAAAPPFSTALAGVQPILKTDSIFVVQPDMTLSFRSKGLYLFQQDTTSSTGLAFRVEDDYPKHGKIETLAAPLIYICTKQEYERLQAAGSDKSQFDRVILNITGSTDRARTFMRNYFRRVEWANTYFSSYKEGWKTDRGMIYIIYGPPQEVYLVGDREVWGYKNAYYNGQFTFVKSSTLFDPDNYVLIREKKFADDWYQMIDLWRKARF